MRLSLKEEEVDIITSALKVRLDDIDEEIGDLDRKDKTNFEIIQGLENEYEAISRVLSKLGKSKHAL